MSSPRSSSSARGTRASRAGSWMPGQSSKSVASSTTPQCPSRPPRRAAWGAHVVRRPASRGPSPEREGEPPRLEGQSANGPRKVTALGACHYPQACAANYCQAWAPFLDPSWVRREGAGTGLPNLPAGVTPSAGIGRPGPYPGTYLSSDSATTAGSPRHDAPLDALCPSEPVRAEADRPIIDVFLGVRS